MSSLFKPFFSKNLCKLFFSKYCELISGTNQKNVIAIFLMKRLFSLCPKYFSFLFFNSINHQLYIKIKLEFFFSFFFFLKNFFEFSFNSLVDIFAIDFPNRKLRFTLVYNLVSLPLNFRLFLFLNFSELSVIPSVSSIFFSANCLEREVWDLFGIFFIKHPDLRRILSDYGFDGFALRKDFPLTGYVEVRFEEFSKRIIYEPIELSQEYRFFDFQTPWRPFSL